MIKSVGIYILTMPGAVRKPSRGGHSLSTGCPGGHTSSRAQCRRQQAQQLRTPNQLRFGTHAIHHYPGGTP